MVQQEGPGVLFRGLKPAFAFQIAVNGTRLGAALARGAVHGDALRRPCLGHSACMAAWLPIARLNAQTARGCPAAS